MKERLYFGMGLVCVGLGIIGAALPIMPTVVFLVMALFFFARSNPEWERRLLEHPTYGQSLRDWRDRRAINRKGKAASVLAMAAGVGFTWFTLGFPYAWISVAVLVLAGGWILTRPH
ncbi:hypothetical protein HME9302_00614 [Alteripontixanthobacter maritimus]|uniref:DUF454 domain-containing protein n=1 Tax=Alteripontixanthobacter maritimus TaxID=2161824 RepID=A0A369Q8C7_9SPHN|nr:YbaN family protein [Alteripontixanthobacter maritimus]RDC59426.1 hypothetical protein HME9302_00614 [Alteripontixanthobacter maritimus]